MLIIWPLPIPGGRETGWGGRVTAGVLSSQTLKCVLPIARLLVDCHRRTVLVESGCTDNIIYLPCYEQFSKRPVAVTTVCGEQLSCDGVGRVNVETSSGQKAEISVLVMDRRPLGVELILGMNGISGLGGVIVMPPSDVVFCGGAVAPEARLAVDAPDCEVHFDD